MNFFRNIKSFFDYMVFFTFLHFTDHARQVAATGGGLRPQCDKELFVLYSFILCLFNLLCCSFFVFFSSKHKILYLICEKGHKSFFAKFLLHIMKFKENLRQQDTQENHKINITHKCIIPHINIKYSKKSLVSILTLSKPVQVKISIIIKTSLAFLGSRECITACLVCKSDFINSYLYTCSQPISQKWKRI